MMFDLSGKAALVTGASGSIGGAIARSLHARGATVGLSGTRKEALDALAAALGDHVSMCCLVILPTRMRSKHWCRAPERNAKVDILVANAGVNRGQSVRAIARRGLGSGHCRQSDGHVPADPRRSVAMMRRRWGRVIAISSVVGFTGNPGQGNYTASKGRHGRHDKVGCRRVRQTQHYCQLYRAGSHRVGYDRKAERGSSARPFFRAFPPPSSELPRTWRRLRNFLASNEAAYVERADHSCERRDGHGLTVGRAMRRRYS